MKITILSEHLQKTLPLINRAISLRNQLPILQNIFLEAKKGIITIKGTDLELGIETKIPGSVEVEGETTVIAKPFTELINSIPNEKITLQTEDDKLVVKSKKTKSVFQTLAGEDYPNLYEEKGQKILGLSNNTFKHSLGPILFATGIDMAKPVMTGVYIEKKQAEIILVATDGYRLSLKKEMVKDKQEELVGEKPIIVPVRILRELMSIKTEGETGIFIAPSSNQLLVMQDSVVMVSRLIEGTFPAYEKIIPESHETKALFLKDEIQQAIKTSSIFAKDAGNVIRFKIEKNQIVIAANTPSLGENSVEVEATLAGDENEIAFNARYLLDLFNNIDGEEIEFEMTGPLSPGVFKIKGDPSFLHLIMPIRLQE